MKCEMRDWISARYPSEKSESPIEQLFHASLTMMWDLLHIPRAGVQYGQQQVLGNYRADFLFTVKAKSGETVRIVVELDGHDFHERTKEQASRDKARDRWMTGQGIQVMRFSGSEVWRNPFSCVSEVADRLHQTVHGMTAKRARMQAGLDAIRKIIDGT